MTFSKIYCDCCKKLIPHANVYSVTLDEPCLRTVECCRNCYDEIAKFINKMIAIDSSQASILKIYEENLNTRKESDIFY